MTLHFYPLTYESRFGVLCKKKLLRMLLVSYNLYSARGDFYKRHRSSVCGSSKKQIRSAGKQVSPIARGPRARVRAGSQKKLDFVGKEKVANLQTLEKEFSTEKKSSKP